MCSEVGTGRKLEAEEERPKTVSRLQHQEVVGRVQTGRAGLEWGDPASLWSRSSKKERKDLVVSEVAKTGQDKYRVKAVAQGQQGHWTTWESVGQARLSFFIRATYDTLPCRRSTNKRLVPKLLLAGLEWHVWPQCGAADCPWKK